MFDPVRITLATPPVTPGRVATKVTVLSPQFEIGANSDVWDEALQGASAPLTSDSRSAALRGVPEAGKVWDKGRNWTTVVLEVVPGTLPGSSAEGGDGNPNTPRLMMRTSWRLRLPGRMRMCLRFRSLCIWIGMRMHSLISRMLGRDLSLMTRLPGSWLIGWCLVWAEFSLRCRR